VISSTFDNGVKWY